VFFFLSVFLSPFLLDSLLSLLASSELPLLALSAANCLVGVPFGAVFFGVLLSKSTSFARSAKLERHLWGTIHHPPKKNRKALAYFRKT